MAASIVDAISALSAKFAGDMAQVERGLLGLAAQVDSRIQPLSASLQSLSEEVHSVIDDQSDASNANTWSIDKVKAFVKDEIAKALAEHVQNTAAATTDIDFVAAYLAAKNPAPATTPAADVPPVIANQP